MWFPIYNYSALCIFSSISQRKKFHYKKVIPSLKRLSLKYGKTLNIIMIEVQ